MRMIGLTALLLATTAGSSMAQDTRAAREARERARSEIALRGIETDMQRALFEAQLALRSVDVDLVQQQAQFAMQAAELRGFDSFALMAELDVLRGDLSRFGMTSRARSVDFSGWQAELDELQPAMRELPQDPADSLWRVGRSHINRGAFDEAAAVFRRIRTDARFASSGYRPEAYYWEAFALSRQQDAGQLQRARELLAQMTSTYPQATHVRDAAALATTIEGRLARTGDARAAESVVARAMAEEALAVAGVAAGRRSGSRPAQCPVSDNEDVQLAALSALLTMDSDRTIPVLREVMGRRDVCDAPLRRRALLLVSRSRSPEAVPLLVEAARNDPEPEIRQQAVLFLGQVRSDAARTELQSILRSADDVELQKRALLALTRRDGEDGTAILREYAGRNDAPMELRRQAILLLAGQRDQGGNAFLREMFASTREPELRVAMIMAMGRDRSAETAAWLLDVAGNTNETMEVRKQALFLGGQTETVPVDRLVTLYRRFDDAELKKQVLYTVARRSEPAALDLLMDVAQNDPDVDLRKSAVFWLGQSKDPRAAQLLMDIIRR
jgi:TolA-binding protein